MHTFSPNNPALKSWVPVPAGSHFPIQNLPFGIFSVSGKSTRVGVAIGDMIVDLQAVSELGLLSETGFETADFASCSLNRMMKHGKQGVRALRTRLSQLLQEGNDALKAHAANVLVDMDKATMKLPVEIGDYTDFYSSIEHATNVGSMFRPDNPLLPNWKHLPVGYHGRASSIVVSGTPVRRPMGQYKPNPDEPPVFGACRQLDFELEMAFITFDGKPMGERISTTEADDYIFGLALFNDWSARDIQAWEYVPLGPFLAKNFASSMSPWIVTLDALEPFRVSGPEQDPKVLPYLAFTGARNLDIHLEVHLKPEDAPSKVICTSNTRYLYWNMAQQLAHHTVNGCNIRCGDVMASGTISGPEKNSYGSMLELTWRGTQPIDFGNGVVRRFIEDNDEMTITGWAEKDGVKIGFGQVAGNILPSTPYV
jgi:fumarylacetoacetase